MGEEDNNPPQIGQEELQDVEAAVAFMKFRINRPKTIKIEVMKMGEVYRGEFTVPAPVAET